MNWIKKILVGLLVLYVICCGVLYFNQEKLIFLPHDLPEDYQYRDGKEVRVEVDDGIALSCVLLEKPNPKGFIIYLHGNKGNNRRCLKQAYQFNLEDYNLIMPDYRGFGKSDGVPLSEDQMLGDVQKVYDYVVSEYDPAKIIVVGYSLGSGMASYLAANNRVDELFLIAPFTSISDLKDGRFVPVPDFLVKYNFDNNERLKEVDCPITIFHSNEDEIIPYKCSTQMKSNNPSLIDLVTLDQVSHRSSIFNSNVSRTFSQKLARISNKIGD